MQGINCSGLAEEVLGAGVLLQLWVPSGCGAFWDRSLQTPSVSVTSSPKSASTRLKEPVSFAPSFCLSDVIEAAAVGCATPHTHTHPLN